MLEKFCQPCGWYLLRYKPAPTFFIVSLTDIEGNPYFAACLTFYESVSQHQLTNSSGFDEKSDSCYNRSMLGSHNPSYGSMSNKWQYNLSNLGGFYYENQSLNFHSQSSLDGSTSSNISVTIPQNQSMFEGKNFQMVRPPESYSPKCLVLLARHQHFDVLRVSFMFFVTYFISSILTFTLICTFC